MATVGRSCLELRGEAWTGHLTIEVASTLNPWRGRQPHGVQRMECHDPRWRLRHGTGRWKQRGQRGKKEELRHRSHGKTAFPEGIILRTTERSNKMRTKIENASFHFWVRKIGKFLLAAVCFPCKIRGLQDGGGERVSEVIVLHGSTLTGEP